MSVIYDVYMHRTTLNLDEGLYLRIRKLAEKTGGSITQTVSRLLKQALVDEEGKRSVELPLHCENGPRDGVDISDRDALYDLMEDLDPRLRATPAALLSKKC